MPAVTDSQRGLGTVPCAAGRAVDAAASRSVPEGVLDLRPGLLGVALDLVTAALGAQAPVAGGTAGSLWPCL